METQRRRKFSLQTQVRIHHDNLITPELAKEEKENGVA